MEEIKIEINKILYPEDFDESVEMLNKLEIENLSEALSLSYQILEKQTGDEYYQATAFETIYGISQQEGFDYIRQNINRANFPVYNSMLECVTVDSGIYDESEGIESIIQLLKNRMLTLKSDESERIEETLNWFKNTYSQFF